MGDVHIEKIAYSKFILHAAKYPHCAVNGLLIAENKGKGNKDELVIVDAVPLFHHSHNLAPMAEVALTKIDLDTQANKRMIVGYYAACENFNDKTPEKCPSQKIAEKIVEFFPKAIFLVIDNSKFLNFKSLESTPKGSPLAAGVRVFRYNDNKWRPIESDSLSLASTPEKLNTFLLGFDGIKKLVDFDNYLDDITLDWTNSEIEKIINNIGDDYISKSEPSKAQLNNDYEDEDEEESSLDSSE